VPNPKDQAGDGNTRGQQRGYCRQPGHTRWHDREKHGQRDYSNVQVPTLGSRDAMRLIDHSQASNCGNGDGTNPRAMQE
jgi:hypothetical protein